MLSVIVPTYNESENLPALCERIACALSTVEHEAIFVDDSTDTTPEVLESLARLYPNVRFEHRENARGLSSAVMRGFEMARGSCLAVMDADLQHPPELLRALYEAVQEGADFCVTSRFIPGGSNDGLHAFRRFVSWTARSVGKLLLPSIRPVSDPTTGFFALRAGVLEGAQISPVGWKILIELLAVCRYGTIAEMPMAFADRAGGSTKFSLAPTFQYLEQVVSLRHRAVVNPQVVVVRIGAADVKRLSCGQPLLAKGEA